MELEELNACTKAARDIPRSEVPKLKACLLYTSLFGSRLVILLPARGFLAVEVEDHVIHLLADAGICLLYTSPTARNGANG